MASENELCEIYRTDGIREVEYSSRRFNTLVFVRKCEMDDWLQRFSIRIRLKPKIHLLKLQGCWCQLLTSQ